MPICLMDHGSPSSRPFSSTCLTTYAVSVFISSTSFRHVTKTKWGNTKYFGFPVVSEVKSTAGFALKPRLLTKSTNDINERRKHVKTGEYFTNTTLINDKMPPRTLLGDQSHGKSVGGEIRDRQVVSHQSRYLLIRQSLQIKSQL